MHFFLQSDKFTLDKEILDLKYVLSNFGNQYIHDVDEITISDIKVAKFGQGVNIPVGTLDFVGAYLDNIKGSSYMKPLEIPDFLQKEVYLKRKYRICKFKDLPKTGIYFIKDASFLKNWDAKPFLMQTLNNDIPKLQDDWEEHDYVCSEVIDTILAEYRILVHEDEVVGVQYYSGIKKYNRVGIAIDTFKTSGVLSFPDEKIISSIVNDIRNFRNQGGIFPMSYTLDVAVTPDSTVLLEVHNFVSCGTYGFCGKELIYMYRNGIEFELSS